MTARKPDPAAASPEARAKSIAEWRDLMRRYPLGSRGALWFQIATTLSANGLIAWLVATGRMTPLELVVLVALEAALLIGLAWLQSRTVPREAREQDEIPWRARLGTLAFGLVWLAGVYGVVLFAFVPSGDEVTRLLGDPLAFVGGSNLKWPLLVTAVSALLDALGDHAHWRRHGGRFLSTPGFAGGARVLTLFLGGLPFVVPAAAIVFGVNTLLERLSAWNRARGGKVDDREALIAAVVVPLFAVAFFAVFGTMIGAGVSAWAVGYCAAKFVSELFVVSLPLIAAKAHAEESAAAESPAGAHRKSRLP